MRFLIIAGFVFFFGSIILIFTNLDGLKVDRYGKIVNMKIESLPKNCFSGNARYFVTYSYQGKLYDRATGGNYCETHYVGEIVKMKVLEGYHLILRPDESAMSNLISFGIVGLIGLGISIFQVIKMKNGLNKNE